jgi:isoamyl acetate esterase
MIGSSGTGRAALAVLGLAGCWALRVAYTEGQRRRCIRQSAAPPCSPSPGWRLRRGVIAVFGDSITEQGSNSSGWVAALASAYTRRADVVNRGFSGYTTRQFRAMLPDILATLPAAAAADVMAITLAFGANDAAAPGDWQHVPPAEFGSNLAAILRALRGALPRALLLVLAPPHVDDRAWEEHCAVAGYAGGGGGRSAARAAEYGAIAADAARGVRGGGCFFVDVRALMVSRAAATAAACPVHCGGGGSGGSGGAGAVAGKGGPPPRKRQTAEDVLGAMLSDGLHLSPSGNAVLFGAVMGVLRANNLAPASLPMHYPGLPEAFEVDLTARGE